MATRVSGRRRRLSEPQYAVKVYQMHGPFGYSGSPETVVVQQLVKRGNRYVADEGKQRVISFAMFPGEKEQEMTDAIFKALRGELQVSRVHLTKDMKAEVKRVVVPVLHKLGFDGTFWKFRRIRKTEIDLLTFIFPKGKGFFFVKIGTFPRNGIELRRETLPAAKVEMKHLASEKTTSQMFEYDSTNLNQVTEAVVEFVRG